MIILLYRLLSFSSLRFADKHNSASRHSPQSTLSTSTQMQIICSVTLALEFEFTKKNPNNTNENLGKHNWSSLNLFAFKWKESIRYWTEPILSHSHQYLITYGSAIVNSANNGDTATEHTFCDRRFHWTQNNLLSSMLRDATWDQIDDGNGGGGDDHRNWEWIFMSHVLNVWSTHTDIHIETRYCPFECRQQRKIWKINSVIYIWCNCSVELFKSQWVK